MLTIFDKSFEHGISLNDKLTYLNGTNQLTTFRTHDRELQSVTTKILFLLGSPNSRLEGLTLLKTVLNQCHHDIFVSNAKNWAESAITVLKSSDSCICKDLACSILNMILVNLAHIPSLRSEVSSSIFSELIPVLVSHSSDDEWILAATKCLSVCMQNFPTLLSPYKKKIEEFLGTQVNTLVCAEVVADCYAQLTYCNPRGNSFAFCRDEWSTQFQKMLNTLHLILNDFLFEVEDPSIRAEFSIVDENNLINIIPSLENIYSLLMAQARTFSVIARTLAKMMCSKSRTSLNIPIVAVLHFVHRLLAVSIDDRVARSADEIHLIYSLLPDMRCSTLTVFEALILSCQNNLIQHSNFVGEIFVQSFKISREIRLIKRDETSVESPFRQTILKVLIVWMKRIGRAGSHVILKHRDLIIELLNDILPKEPQQIMTSSNVNQSTDINNQIIHKEMCDDSISSFYIETIKALSTIVYVSGNSMDRYLLKTILQQVLFIVNKIQYLPVIPAPYYDARCRKKLYSLLLTTVITAAPYFKQSVSASAKIFKYGLRDSSEEVSGLCNKAFSYLNPTLHPFKACPEAPAIPQAIQSTGPQYSNEYTQNKNVSDNFVPWAVNGVQSVSEKFQLQSGNDMEEVDIQYSSRGYSSPELSNPEEECNGVEHIPQSSSHDDNESVEEEEEEESEDMEEEESEDMDSGVPMLSDSPSYIRDRNLASSQAKTMLGKDNDMAEHDISNSIEPSTDYDNRAAEGELLNNREYYPNESINQNGVYETEEEVVEEEEAELGIEVEESAPIVSKKRALENSYESLSPKKLHAESMDQELEEDSIQDEPAEQNALDMIGDFVSVSPDESQS